jgi:plastocyanin
MISKSALSIDRSKRPYVLLGSLVAALLAAAVTKSLAARPAIVIKMLDMPPSFQPARTIVRAGDTVEWKNVGNQFHHVTNDPSAALKKNDVTNPPGTKPFDSGFLKPGETFNQTFSIPGIYRYTCAVHEAKGMNGEVVVQK